MTGGQKWRRRERINIQPQIKEEVIRNKVRDGVVETAEEERERDPVCIRGCPVCSV